MKCLPLGTKQRQRESHIPRTLQHPLKPRAGLREFLAASLRPLDLSWVDRTEAFQFVLSTFQCRFCVAKFSLQVFLFRDAYLQALFCFYDLDLNLAELALCFSSCTKHARNLVGREIAQIILKLTVRVQTQDPTYAVCDLSFSQLNVLPSFSVKKEEAS